MSDFKSGKWLNKIPGREANVIGLRVGFLIMILVAVIALETQRK